MGPEDALNSIFRYFWFIAAMVGVLNYFIIQIRIPDELKEDSEYGGFKKGFLLFLTVPPALLGLLQTLGDFPHPFYVFTRDFQNVFIVLSWAVLFFTWGVFLFWVHYKDGARILVKFGKAFRGMPENENVVKILFTFIVLISIAALVVGVGINLADKAPGMMNK